MAYDLDVGGGGTVRVNEPTRGSFPDNLGGAVEFSLVHFVYKVFEVMGGALGTFGAGMLVKFLDIIEPGMIDYVTPLIDAVVDAPECPGWLRDYLVKIKSGEDFVGAGLAAAIGTQAGGAVVGSVLSVLTAPLTQAINTQIRPTRLSASEAFAMLWRGKLDDPTLQDWLSDVGYPQVAIDGYSELLRPRLDVGSLVGWSWRMQKNPEAARGELLRRGYEGSEVDRIFELSHVIPALTDLLLMAVREAWRDDVADYWKYDEDFPVEFAEWAQKQGLDPIWAKRYWRAHWRLPSVTLGFEMYHRKIIGAGELTDLLKISDYPAGWRQKMIDVAYRPYTRVDVRRMYSTGVLDESQVYDSYRDLGYDHEKATNMTTFTVRYVDRDGTNPLYEMRELTRTVITKSYEKGIIDRGGAITRLMAIGYTETDIDLILSLTEITMGLGQFPDYLEDYRKDLKNTLERSYTRRLISKDEAKEHLVLLGYPSREADLILAAADFYYSEVTKDKGIKIIGDSYVRRAISRTRAIELMGRLALGGAEQTQIFREWDNEREMRSRRLSEAQYRKCLKFEIISVEGYRENLKGLGYTDYDIDLLVELASG